MTRKIGIFALALLLTTTFTASVYAGGMGQAEGMRDQSLHSPVTGQPQSYQRAYQATDAIGAMVKDQQGQNVGTISDIVFDTNGRVPFFIVSSNMATGRQIAIPFKALQYETGSGLMVNVSSDMLRNAPAWNRNVLNDRTAATDIYRHFGIQPYWEPMQRDMMQRDDRATMRPQADAGSPLRAGAMRPPMRAYQATDAIGALVKDQQGRNIGTISDIVFDTSGRVPFIILSSTAVDSAGKQVAIPFDALRYQMDSGLVANVSSDMISNAPAWNRNVLNDRNAAYDIYRHFGVQPYWEGTMEREIIHPEISPGMRPGATPGSSYRIPTPNGQFQPAQPRPDRLPQ
jgi:uncharacterized protein YrrD